MRIDFKKGGGLVPAIVQDARTGNVLMLAYMDRAALAKTRRTGCVTFFSRSRKKLWTKGETSGNRLRLISLAADCDGDTLLIKAEPSGPICHTGSETCFGAKSADNIGFLSKLEEIVDERKRRPVKGSYTASLFKEGLNRIAQKVGEEAVELVIASKDKNRTRIKNETADLLFHLLVLLREKSITLGDVAGVLEKRHGGPRRQTG